MQTSFHVGGFWLHVAWDDHGQFGRDQHGNVWCNQAAPYSPDNLHHIYLAAHDAILTTNINKLYRNDQTSTNLSPDLGGAANAGPAR